MVTITFNAFSFLQPKLAAKQIACSNARIDLPEGTTIEELMANCGLAEDEVEAVFLNSRLASPDRTLHNGDRVAFVPPGGTPGPYRVLLGMKNLPQQ